MTKLTEPRVRAVRPKAPPAFGWRPLEPATTSGAEEVFIGNGYEVHRLAADPNVRRRADSVDEALWLVVYREDRKPARDWRHLQAIKSELAGPEREAVEIFPAESRLLDVGNATHVWVLPVGERVPFGYEGPRRILDSRQGVAQRPLASSAVTSVKVGRNEPCSCGSGKKSKHCCYA